MKPPSASAPVKSASKCAVCHTLILLTAALLYSKY